MTPKTAQVTLLVLENMRIVHVRSRVDVKKSHCVWPQTQIRRVATTTWTL